MADDDDKFSDDEVKDFEALTDDERTKLGRYIKWAGQKENPGEKSKPPASPALPDGSAEIDLATLRRLMADPTALSILDHLRASPPQSPAKDRPKGDAPKPKLARFL
jgi:hypothetical protein